MSDASDNSTTVNKYLVPVTTDNIVLKWDGNTASLAGILYETFQFWDLSFLRRTRALDALYVYETQRRPRCC